MSARFVSSGAIDTQTGHAVALPTTTQPDSSAQKKDEWAAVQEQLEAERQAREAKRKAAVSGEGGGKSLYEVLEANKAAKQAAFEEANKIRNQFRALDEDEIEFLEEVEMSKREKAEAEKKEIEEGLKKFQEARKNDEHEDGEEEIVTEWKFGGKRKRRNGKAEVSVVKMRKKMDEVVPEPVVTEPAAATPKPKLGLVAYGSDDDDSE